MSENLCYWFNGEIIPFTNKTIEHDLIAKLVGADADKVSFLFKDVGMVLLVGRQPSNFRIEHMNGQFFTGDCMICNFYFPRYAFLPTTNENIVKCLKQLKRFGDIGTFAMRG